MSSEERFWFEVPPYADVLDPSGKVWNVGDHKSQASQVIVTSYDTKPAKILLNIQPWGRVAMATYDNTHAFIALANAGFAIQIVE
jgi:hypothetical protein